MSKQLQQPPPLYDSHGYLQQSDQQDLMNQNMMNSFQGANVSTTVSPISNFSNDQSLLIIV